MAEMVLGIKVTADSRGASAEIEKLADKTNKLQQNSSSAAKSGKQLENSISGLGKTALAAGAAYVTLNTAISAGRAFIQAADSMALMEARLRLVTTGSAQFSAVFQQLYAQSQKIGTSLDSNVALYARLARAFEGSGRSAKDLLSVVDTLNKALLIGGASTAEASSAILQFAQAMGAGKLQGEEFRAMMESAPNLLYAIAKAAGVPKEELKKMAEQGVLTADLIVNAMLKMGSAFDEQAEKMPNTFGRAFQRMTTSIMAWNAEIAKSSGLVDDLAGVMDKVTGFFDDWTGMTDGATVARKAAEDAAFAYMDLQQKFAKNPAGTNIIEQHYQTEELAKAKKRLDEARAAMQATAPVAKQTAETLKESFGGAANYIGKAGIEIEKLTKKQKALIIEVGDEAKRQGVNIALAVAIAEQESTLNKNIGKSVDGAIGPMQLMPKTAARMGVNPYSEVGNIKGGVSYIRLLTDKVEKELTAYKLTVDQKMALIAAGYIGGEGKIDYFKKNGKLPQAADGNGKSISDYAADVTAKMKKYEGEVVKTEDAIADYRKTKQDEALRNFTAILDKQEAYAEAAASNEKQRLQTQIEDKMRLLNNYQNAQKQNSAGITDGAQKVEALRQARDVEVGWLREVALIKAQQIAQDQAVESKKLTDIKARIVAEQQAGNDVAEISQLQGQQATIQARLVALSEERAREEANAGQAVADASAQVVEAQQEQVAATQELADARKAILERLDEEIAKMKELSDGTKEYHDAQKAAKDLQGKAYDDFMKQFKEKQNALNSLKKADELKKKAEQAVSDDILRQGQYYQTMAQMAQNAARGMSESFGETGKAIGGMVVAIADARNNIFQIQQQTDAMIAKHVKDGGAADDAKAQEIAMQGQTQELAAQANLFGNVAAAAQGFFQKGTAGYEAMGAAAQAFRAIEMAITVASIAEKAILAITTQAGAGPYIGFALMAAMAAALAGIGAYSGGGVSGSAPSKADMLKEFGAGTVLGDDSAKSESLANSLKILEKTNTADLAYSAQMTRSLKNIEVALTGVTSTLLLRVNSFTALAGTGLKQGDGKIKDYGIGWYPQQIGQILAEGFKVMAYTKGSVSMGGANMGAYAALGGGAALLPEQRQTLMYITSAGKEVNNEFTRVIKGIVGALEAGSKSFGISGADFRSRINDFTIEFNKLSLRDDEGKALKGDALQEAVSAFFSSVADQMAADLNIEALDQFQRAGEGLFETLTRVASGIDESRGALSALGIAVIDYRNVELKQAEDIGAEIVRQSIMVREGSSAIGAFMVDTVGSIEDLITVYKSLKVITDQMSVMGLNAENISRDMTNAAGGVQALADAMDSFKSSFFNEGEQIAMNLTTLSRQFADFGQAMPQSKEAFKAMILGIDTTSKAGQELFGHLIGLADAFAQASEQADALEKKYQSYVNPFAGYQDRLKTVMDDFASIIDAKLGVIEANFQNSETLRKNTLNGPLQGQITWLTNYNATRNSEITQNMQYLNQTIARIDELNALIAKWSGQKGAQAYVDAWTKDLEGMNKQAAILRQDLAAKTDEVTRINNEILALNDQIKNNNDSVDVAALEEKIRSITETRNNLLRQQGDAIIATLQEVFKDMVAGFKDVRQSILQQMADLAGGKYPRVLAGMNERSARQDLNQYMKTGNDPQEILSRVSSLKDAIMAHYQEEYDRLVRLQEKQNRVQTREINSEYREKIQEERKELRQIIRQINQRYADEIRQIEKAKTARQREADREIRAIEKRAQKEEERLNNQLDRQMERLQKRNRAEEEVLQKQIQNIQALKSALDQIKEFAKSLKTGNLSALSPEDKIKAAQKEYDDLLKRAKGGDAEAAGKLSGASQTLLELLKSYFGSNPQYAAIFTKMQKELEALGNSKIGPTEESVQKKLDKLMDQNKKEEEKLRKTFENKIDQVRNQADKDSRIAQRNADIAIKKMDRQIQVLENTRDRTIRAAEKNTDRIIRKLETSRDKEIEQLTNPNKNEAIKDLKQKTIGKLQHLAEIVAEQEKKARDQMGTLIDETRALNVLNVAQLQQLNKLGQYYGIDPTPVPKFASGGMHKGGWMIAGENGPELMYAPASTVLNAKDTREAFQSDPKVVEKLEQIKKELEAIVRGNSSADPAIIAELKTLNDRMENIERLNRLAA